MQWQSLSDFFAMGGYALYVWSSFGITAAVVVLEIWQLRAHRRALLCNLRAGHESQALSDSDTQA